MPHCAVKWCGNKTKPRAALSFHHLPVRDPGRLKLWLSALGMDPNTPPDELRRCIVCSEHFVPGDYSMNGQQRTKTRNRFLTPTAVPTVNVSSRVERGSGRNRTKDILSDPLSSEDTQPASEELLPPLHQREHLQVKEEQVDQCMDTEESKDCELKHPKSEAAADCELFPSSSAVTVSLNERIDDRWSEAGGSSSPRQSHSVEVVVELEEPPREEKSCRFCSKRFKKDSVLIRHVKRSHKGHKAFKCLHCNKQFEQRYQLVMHTRIHTGERPFRCDYCDKTFSQNSSRLAHMRVHTGGKPYFCVKCGKSFATSNHFKLCKMQKECEITAERDNAERSHKEEKAFKCFQCNKEFNQKHQLVLHARVHSGEKPFSCDFCGKTFPQNSSLSRGVFGMDPNTPPDELRRCIDCSEHFVPGDYSMNGQQRTKTRNRFLTPTAVPTVNVSSRVEQDSGRNRTKDVSSDSLSSKDTQLASEELLPPLHQRDIKGEQTPAVEETQIQEHLQVKEEQVDQCMDTDESKDCELKHPKSEVAADCELFPSSSAVTVSLNKRINNVSSSPLQSHSVEVVVELEEPPREEKSCRFCSKRFKKDSVLIRHVKRSHKGHKAFKCLHCNKQFEQRYQLVMHTRIHTGERPFRCDYCDKTFSQNSSRLAHMRVHTGEKPYFCVKCGKSFATSNHFKLCKMQKECKITAERDNADQSHKEEKAFKCFQCNKEFNQKHQLVLHARVHSGEKPFSCDFCGKTFTQNSNRIVHMRQHTGEKPYLCKKCGKRFANSHHLKMCTGTQNKSRDKPFRCTTCGRTFHTDSDLKVHTEVHKAWKQHISKKLQEQERKL